MLVAPPALTLCVRFLTASPHVEGAGKSARPQGGRRRKGSAGMEAAASSTPTTYLNEALETVAKEKDQWPLVAAFERQDYGPGDTIEGCLVAYESVKARELSVDLRYIDSSFAYKASEVHLDPTVLHADSIEKGQEFPFSLQLPGDALPTWAAPKVGVLFWAVGARVERRLRTDLATIHPVPMSQSRALWAEAEPPTAGDVADEEDRKRLDVELEPDRRTLRRGEELRVGVRIGEPAAGRSLAVGLVCVHHFDAEVPNGGNNGGNAPPARPQRSGRGVGATRSRDRRAGSGAARARRRPLQLPRSSQAQGCRRLRVEAGRAGAEVSPARSTPGVEAPSPAVGQPRSTR